MKIRKRLGVLIGTTALALLLAACGHVGKAQEHPLTGKVWDVSARRFVAHDVLLERAATSRFVLLGEIHDNAEHHRIQARLLQELLRKGRRPAMVMEQFDLDRADRIGEIRRGTGSVEQKLQELRELMREGWEWPHYEPLLRLALEHELPLAPANMARDTLRKVAREGLSALGEGEDRRLAADSVWSAPRQTQLARDVRDGHCGKLPEHVAEMITKAQRIRDAVMADAILKFMEPGAVAIIGNGHARTDMGVPLYLRARAPESSVLSLGLVQVQGSTDPRSYAESALGERFDYVWFTEAGRRTVDPCHSIPGPAAPVQTPG